LRLPGSLLAYDDGWNDGLHPDDEGDRVIAQAVLDELGPVVGAPCEDGVDNDGDGYVDFPGDAGCDGPSDWSEGLAVLECEDGVDNDGDGAIDLDDFGCQGQGDFSERTAPDGIACDDGIDNDGDGSIDYPGDAGCGSPVQTEENPGCNDGIDNDGDGLIDFDGGDSLDLDRDGYVDPEFNPAEPEVTTPDPYCRAASLSREEPEEPDEPGKPGCGRGRGWAWGWGRIFHPPWQKECRWRCNAFDQDRVPDWVDWREAPPRWSDRDEDGENWGQSVDGDDDDTGGDSEWSEARGRKRGGGDAAGDSERRGAKGGNRPQRRGR
jgi:hypothetical protein